MTRPAAPARRSLRWRLVLLTVALAALGLFGAQVFIAQGLERNLDAHVRDELGMHADLAGSAIVGAGAWDTPRADGLVRTLARQARARVSLIAPDGRVVADSDLPPDALSLVDNHGRRPEVLAARAGRRAVVLRDSDTLHRPLTYAATRVSGPGGHWVVRVAVSPALAETTHAATQRLLAAGGVLGLLLAAVAAAMAMSAAAAPLRALTDTARAMTHDLTVRTRVRRDDEVGALAAALDALADNLATSLRSLETQRDRLGAMLEAMTEGVLVTDATGTIVLANRALREGFAVGAEALGRTPIEALPSADLHEMLDEAAAARAPVSREFSLGGVRPRRVVARVAPIDDPHGGAVVVLFDVTELRRLETVRRDFVANVSHELRTPVAAIRAAVETLLLGALARPDTAREFVDILDRHAARLHRLVEELLELSRIEAGQRPLTREALAPRAEVDRALELMHLAARARDQHIVNAVDETLPRVMADRRGLEHVLTNLLDNALKYGPDGGAVTVSARRDGDRVWIEVQDEGPGIEARHLPRLFERFYRVDASRSRALGGTGLGLAIVKHLAESMGGAVSVQSTVGVGTRFGVGLRVAG